MSMKKSAAALLIAAMFALLPFQPDPYVFAESENTAVFCDIRGYEDFYYFPVTACDGNTYYMYVSNFGDGCDFSMDTRAEMSGFQYRSVLAMNIPAKEYKNISLKKANAYLDGYDFRAMKPGNWTDDNTEDYINMGIFEKRSLQNKRKTEYANKCIAVMEDLKLTKKFDGNIEKLSQAPYNETKINLDIEIVKYSLYTGISAKFFDYNGKTVVKLSGTDFSAFSELTHKNKKTVPKYEETYEAYYKSSEFEGYFYCDPEPLEEYFGKNGEKPAKKAKTYYKDPSNTGKTLLNEELDGKPLSFFLDSENNKPKDSNYYVIGSAAVCPPDEAVYHEVYDDLLYFGDPKGHIFRLWEIEKEDADLPENAELKVKLNGKLFGNPCKYYEYFPTEKAYTAVLIFNIGNNRYKAEATAYDYSWDFDLRKPFREFFGSIKPAGDLKKNKFGKAPSDYFKKYKISENEYASACGGLKLWIPESLSDTYSTDTYFFAADSENKKSMRVDIGFTKSYDNKPLKGTYQNYHRTVFHKNISDSDAIESKLKKLYRFKRDGNKCTLAVKEQMDFVLGWQTVYEYYIDCKNSFYSVVITVPEGSENSEEEALKILSSIKTDNGSQV